MVAAIQIVLWPAIYTLAATTEILPWPIANIGRCHWDPLVTNNTNWWSHYRSYCDQQRALLPAIQRLLHQESFIAGYFGHFIVTAVKHPVPSPESIVAYTGYRWTAMPVGYDWRWTFTAESRGYCWDSILFHCLPCRVYAHVTLAQQYCTTVLWAPMFIRLTTMSTKTTPTTKLVKCCPHILRVTTTYNRSEFVESWRHIFTGGIQWLYTHLTFTNGFPTVLQ